MLMAKKNKKFKTETQEREYWEETDSSEHFNLSQGKNFLNLSSP